MTTEGQNPIFAPPQRRSLEGSLARAGEDLKVLRTLEERSDLQLETCARLVTLLQSATETLNRCGAALQREVQQSLQPLSSCFTREPGNEAETLEDSRCIFSACENLGAALLTMAAALTGDFLTPLVELRRSVTKERQELQQELERLEQREILCCEAMAESVSRKEKVSGELQERVQQSQAKTRDRPSRVVRWIMKKTSKAEGKLQAAAHAQTAAVEELANRLDQLAVVQTQRQEAAEAFGALVQRLSRHRRRLVTLGRRRCAAAWAEGAQVLQAAFPEVDLVPEMPRSPDSAKAIASVPPLRLAELPVDEALVSHMNTASIESPSGSSIRSHVSEILNEQSASENFFEKVPPGDAADVQRVLPREVSFEGLSSDDLPPDIPK